LPHGDPVNEWGEDVIVSQCELWYHDLGAIAQSDRGFMHPPMLSADSDI
jgi:hypothetical protein